MIDKQNNNSGVIERNFLFVYSLNLVNFFSQNLRLEGCNKIIYLLTKSYYERL
jgi:hypothetical protein